LPRPLHDVRAELTAAPHRLDGPDFAWPILTLDAARLDHNLRLMAAACQQYGVWHAPHVKTAMSEDIWRRQAEVGAWAATVATAQQLRTVRDWGASRVLLANELVDRRELAWVMADLAGHTGCELYLEVDSVDGANRLIEGAAQLGEAARQRLCPLIEVGSPGGRTGVRLGPTAVELAHRLTAGGLVVAGVIGYEGPVAAGTSPDALAAIGAWVDQVVAIATDVSDVVGSAARLTGPPRPFVVSLGGSGYLDVILPKLGALAARGWWPVVRAGAYVSHDHGHYAELNPWARLPGEASLQPALAVWAEVLSRPEPGLALLGAGRRDVDYDLALPHPLWWRRPDASGRLGQANGLSPTTHIRELNDQHAFLVCDPTADALAPGDVVGLGISHPCTAFDKWQLAALVDGDIVVDLYPLDF